MSRQERLRERDLPFTNTGGELLIESIQASNNVVTASNVYPLGTKDPQGYELFADSISVNADGEREFLTPAEYKASQLKSYNGCYHEKILYESVLKGEFDHTVLDQYTLTPGSHFRYALTVPSNYAPPWKDDFVSIFDTESPLNILEVSEAAKATYPNVANLAPGINIIEMLSDFTSSVLLLPQILANIRKIPYDTKPRDSLESWAAGHLQYNFALAPLASDLASLLTLSERLDAAIATWNSLAKQGKIASFHASFGLSEKEGPLDLPTGYTDTGIAAVNRHYEGSGTRKGIYSFYVRPKPIKATKLEFVWRALGLHKPLSSSYQALPFSWLVDYIYNLSGWLESLEDNLDTLFNFEVVSAGVSIKNTIDATCWTTLEFRDGFVGDGGTVRLTSEKYTRIPIPNDVAAQLVAAHAAEFTFPSASQSTNVFAVAVQLLKDK
jgi:hypothetical protein